MLERVKSGGRHCDIPLAQILVVGSRKEAENRSREIHPGKIGDEALPISASVVIQLSNPERSRPTPNTTAPGKAIHRLPARENQRSSSYEH